MYLSRPQSDSLSEYFKRNMPQFIAQMRGLAATAASDPHVKEKLQKMWQAAVTVIFTDQASFKDYWPKFCGQAAGNEGLEAAVIYLRAAIAQQTASISWESGGITLDAYQATLKNNLNEGRVDWIGLSEVTPHIHDQLWNDSTNTKSAVKSGLMQYFQDANHVKKLSQKTGREMPNLQNPAPI